MDSMGKLGFGVELGTMKLDKVPFATAFDRSQVSWITHLLTHLLTYSLTHYLLTHLLT